MWGCTTSLGADAFWSWTGQPPEHWEHNLLFFVNHPVGGTLLKQQEQTGAPGSPLKAFGKPHEWNTQLSNKVSPCPLPPSFFFKKKKKQRSKPFMMSQEDIVVTLGRVKAGSCTNITFSCELRSKKKRERQYHLWGCYGNKQTLYDVLVINYSICCGFSLVVETLKRKKGN